MPTCLEGIERPRLMNIEVLHVPHGAKGADHLRIQGGFLVSRSVRLWLGRRDTTRCAHAPRR